MMSVFDKSLVEQLLIACQPTLIIKEDSAVSLIVLIMVAASDRRRSHPLNILVLLDDI